jgi:hypothetical protein
MQKGFRDTARGACPAYTSAGQDKQVAMIL